MQRNFEADILFARPYIWMCVCVGPWVVFGFIVDFTDFTGYLSARMCS